MPHYSFAYNNYEDEPVDGFPSNVMSSKSFEISEDATWIAVLQEFAAFLSSVYGYDIQGKIVVKTIGEETVLKDYYENG